jgi:flagellar biosynthesis protein FlhB
MLGAVQFLAFVAVLSWWGGDWFTAMRTTMRLAVERAFRSELTNSGALELGVGMLRRVVAPLLIPGAALVSLSLAARLVTTRGGLSLKGLMPDLARLSVLSRVRELPRQNLAALVQAVVLLPLAGFAVYTMACRNLAAYLALPFQGVEAGAMVVAGSLKDLLWKAAAVFLVFGIVDMFRQQRRYLRDLRMSKQDVREEMKELEGNPQMKGRIRRLMRDVLRRRMMQEVPTATAVVVNPTHFAVALRYSVDGMAAPKVVAKGKNYLALRIRERAIQHEVPIIENAPLAQALYKSVEVGQEIPPHLYRAVAEILAYIYRLMNGRLPA